MDIFKLEMERKLEEFQKQIMTQASEIIDLKRCLQDLLTGEPPTTELQQNPWNTLNKLFENTSETKTICTSTIQNKKKTL